MFKKDAHAPPPLWFALGELRAIPEFCAGVAAQSLLASNPQGDGHAVMVMPGLMADDLSTALLRIHLERMGHRVEGWGLGRNVGPNYGLEEAIVGKLEALAQLSGRKVSLVGQSLGGSYARLLAARHPDLVRCVVTLGSPSRGSSKANRGWRLCEWSSGRPLSGDAIWSEVCSELSVPCTSVWSSTDAVVAPFSAQGSGGKLSESVEIRGSHLGMAFNPSVLHLVADRLAQPEGAWLPFERSGWRVLVYPAPSPPAVNLV